MGSTYVVLDDGDPILRLDVDDHGEVVSVAKTGRGEDWQVEYIHEAMRELGDGLTVSQATRLMGRYAGYRPLDQPSCPLGSRRRVARREE